VGKGLSTKNWVGGGGKPTVLGARAHIGGNDNTVDKTCEEHKTAAMGKKNEENEKRGRKIRTTWFGGVCRRGRVVLVCCYGGDLAGTKKGRRRGKRKGPGRNKRRRREQTGALRYKEIRVTSANQPWENQNEGKQKTPGKKRLHEKGKVQQKGLGALHGGKKGRPKS